MTLIFSWITSLSWFCCPSTSSCTSVTQGFFRGERKVLLPHKRQSKPCSQCSTDPSSLIKFQRVPAAILITKPFLLVACPWQTHGLQHPGDVLLGQNGLLLGQRGNLPVQEWYLRKLVSDGMGSWPDLMGRLGHTSVGPFQDTGGSMEREERFSSVWVTGRACLKAEFVCWVGSASWSCWDHSCVLQPGSAPPSCSLLAQPEAVAWGSTWQLVLLSYPSCASAAPFPLQE